MQPDHLLVSGGIIIDPVKGSAAVGDILVSNGRIAEVRQGSIEVGEHVARRDATGYIILPGLVNAHTHGHGSLGKGLGDLWTLELLLNASQWASAGFGLEDCYVSAMLNATEMIRKGTTAAYDLFIQIPTPDPAALDTVARGYSDAGMRVVLAPLMADRTFYESVPGLLAQLPEEAADRVQRQTPRSSAEQIKVLRTWLGAWPYDYDRLRPALAPTIPTHCTREFLLGCRDLAKEFEIGIQMHLAESKPQAVAGIETFGKTLTAHLDDLGLLGPNFTGAHCVWLDDDDLSRMADRGAGIVHNPGSNLRLGCGIAPARRMLDKGIRLGVGTDGSGSSDNQNMFEALRLASYVSRATSPDPIDWVSAPEALRMATVGGADVLGLSDRIGRIERGFYADLVFLDLGNINFVPLADPIRQIVQCEDSSALRSVMIGGRFVLDEGDFVSFDFQGLIRKAQTIADRLRERVHENRSFAHAIEGIVLQHCVGLARRSYHIHRYCGC